MRRSSRYDGYLNSSEKNNIEKSLLKKLWVNKKIPTVMDDPTPIP